MSELIALDGMKTNSNDIGVKRLVISKLRPSLGCVPDIIVQHADMDLEPAMLGAHSVFMVKGYTRVLSMHLVLLCAWEVPEFLKAG